MPLPPDALFILIQDNLRQFGRLIILGGLGGGCLLFLLPLLGLGSLLWVLCLFAYLARKGFQLHRVHRIVRQLHLEARFIRHCPDAPYLRRCLDRRHHLWVKSFILQAVHTVCTRPLPRPLAQQERMRHMRRTLRRTLSPLRLAHYNADGLLLLLSGALLPTVLPAYSVAPSILALVTACAAFILLVEVLQTRLQLRMRRHLNTLEQALSEWILSDTFGEAVSAHKPYTHLPLYYMPPLFTHAAVARPASSSSLRRVA